MTKERMSQPDFIDWLDRDRVRCVIAFYSFAEGFFRSSAPRLMRHLAPEELEETQSRIVLHCIRDNCRVLREYRPSEGRFGGWFAILSLNKTKDYIKETARYRQAIAAADERNSQKNPSSAGNGFCPPDEQTEAGEQLRIVTRCVGMLDRYCRLLVRMAAEEFKPREMVRVLRWPQSKAKKVSDDLRYCRAKLRQLLAAEGLE